MPVLAITLCGVADAQVNTHGASKELQEHIGPLHKQAGEEHNGVDNAGWPSP